MYLLLSGDFQFISIRSFWSTSCRC